MRNNPDDLSNQLIQKIKDWLENEIERNQPVVDGRRKDPSAFV